MASLNANNNSKDLDQLVINLSDYTLSDHEKAVLAKGMKFCPTPGEPKFGDLRDDLNKFHMRIKRKLFFNNLSEEDEDLTRSNVRAQGPDAPFNNTQFKEPSKWKPPPVIALELFCRQNEIDLLTKKVPPNKFHNLTREENSALKNLSQNKNIVIKPADKEGAVVVLNIKDYIKEGRRQLSDPKFYIETEHDLTHEHATKINDFLKDIHTQGEIDDNCHEFLSVTTERTSLFYMLPKIHKRLVDQPGRPIVSGNSCPTERISQLVDFFLQPTVKDLPSYVKDTTHFLSKLLDLGNLPDNCILATMDVASLYTNIPNQEGLEAARTALNRNRPSHHLPETESLITMLDMVLHMNNFDFAGRHYLQVGGTAMATKVAPSFANTFMGWFEAKFVYTYELQPLMWVRFIDDIFLIWQHGHDSLKLFEDHLNQSLDSIKFETETSMDEVHFLDVVVRLEDNIISTSLYTKPTDAHNYLSFYSSHPKNCKSAIPYSQFLRIRRICSNDTDFIRHSRTMSKHFLEANYPPKIVQEGFSKAYHKDRLSLLRPPPGGPTKDDSKENDIFLITTYHPSGRILGDIVKQNWDILDRSASTRDVLTWKVVQGFRRPKNIRDMLVRARVVDPTQLQDPSTVTPRPGRTYTNKRCQRKSCRYCMKIDHSGSITSPITGREYNTIRNCDCKTNNIIYCITCIICFKQYIGHTKRTLGERMCEHFRYVTQHNSSHSVGRHYNQEDHQGLGNIRLHVLQFGRKDPDSTLAIRLELEQLWIHRLRSTTPMGLNVFD